MQEKISFDMSQGGIIMKKTMCMILVLLMLVSSVNFVVFAEGFTRIEGVYEVDEFTYTQVESCSISKFEEKTVYNISKNVIGDDGIKYLLGVFSNANLKSIVTDVSDHITPANNPDYPVNGIKFNLKIKNGEYYDFLFDDKHVWYTYNISTDDGIIVFYEGLFEFVDDSTYDGLSEKINEWRAQQEKVNEQNEIDRKKNPIPVSDFNIIYEARIKCLGLDEFTFGVCSYKCDNTYVTALYRLLFDTDTRKIYKVVKSKPVNNTFTIENERILELEGNNSSGVEYDNTLGESWIFKIQINVNNSREAESIRIMSKLPGGEYNAGEYIDMSQHSQSGKLPVGWFSSENNIDYPDKLSYFEKLYSERITTHHGVVIGGIKQGAEREWGICKYSNRLSGDVHAFYLYDKTLDQYYISEIEEVFCNPEIVNVITFDKTRYIHNNFEHHVDYVPNTDHYRLRIGIDQNKEIRSRSFFVYHSSSTASCEILESEYLSGNLSSLELEDYFASDSYKSGLEKENSAREEVIEKENPADDVAVKDEQATEDKTLDEKQSEEKLQDDSSIKPEETDDVKQDIEETQKDNTDETENVEKAPISFVDVPTSHWAYNEISYFSQEGIVLGYGDGYFGVNDSITYEHFALLLKRLFDYDEDDTQPVAAVREDVIVSVVKALNIDVTNVDTKIIYEKFDDCTSIQTKNIKYIAAAIEQGLVIGSYRKLYPHDNLTRAETVMLLHRAIDY